MAQILPLLPDVILVGDDDDMSEFVELEIAGSERHDEIPQPDQGRPGVGEQTHDHVVR